VHRDFADELRFLQLGLQNVLLRAHARTVAGIGGLFDLIQKFSIAFENRQCLREVGELKVRSFDFRKDGTSHGFDLLLRNVRFAFCDFAAQLQLAGIRDVLRHAEPDVGEVAVGVACEGSGASDAQMLQRELWVRQRRDLRRNLFGSLPVLPSGFDLGIVLFRFREQVG